MNACHRLTAAIAFHTLILAIPIVSVANDFAIDSFSRNGEISWTDTNTNGHYRVEWSPSLMQTNWRGDWSGLTQIPATGGAITVSVPMFYRVVHRPVTSAVGQVVLRLVPGGGQLGGPSYDFYMSQRETTELHFLTFLNDAQANPGNARGANMHFAANGDVYMDSAEVSTEILFDSSDSSLIYNDSLPAGSRYSTFPDMENHPITGVSWYGAIKFCNWLTLDSGRGESNLCYAEGAAPGNWHPSNISDAEWADGFDNSERMELVTDKSGFRLPMTDYASEAGHFNEYYKAAAWDGLANRRFGFGRDSITAQDANFRDSGDPFDSFSIATTPGAMYDGQMHFGFSTTSNGNVFGVYDLCGNVAEWSNDSHISGDLSDRVRCGGSFNSSDGSFNNDIYYVGCATPHYSYFEDLPYQTREENGFRIVTTSP